MINGENKFNFVIGEKGYFCPVEVTLDLIGGKWKGIIIFNLKRGTLRFNEIQKQMPSISERMLIKELRDLEKNGLVERKVYAEVPPKVEYSLTEYGKTIIPIIDLICSWGLTHIELYANDQTPALFSPETV